MTVTRHHHESYTMRKAHDPDLDIDLLVRTYAGGTMTVATRPGSGQKWISWGPEVELTREPSELAEACLAHYAEGER